MKRTATRNPARLQVVPAPSEAERFCFRHTARTAHRRCFHCRKDLCPACQIRAEGHIFCSRYCVGTFRRVRLWERLKRWNRTALAGKWFRLVFFGSFLSVAAGLSVLFLNLQWIVPHPQRESGSAAPRGPMPGSRQESPDWDSPGPVTVRFPQNGWSTSENLISVEGTCPPEAMVGLYANDEKVGVQMALGGRWLFSGVPLTAPSNSIQARYFDNDGNSSFSRAVIVRLLGMPVRLPTAPVLAPEPLSPLLSSLQRAPVGRQEVLLTFDGGSNANATAAILEGLAKRGITASMFLTGEYIQKYPELVRRMVREGHCVGNHTFSHPHLTTYSFNGRSATLAGVTGDFLKAQIQRTEELFRSVAGRDMDPFWRAPFGEYNREILAWAAQCGYRHVAWTPRLDTLDWVSDPLSPLYRGPGQILERLIRQADSRPEGLDGGIILMHLGTDREGEQGAQTILEPLISQLSGRGYRFVRANQAWPEEPAREP